MTKEIHEAINFYNQGVTNGIAIALIKQKLNFLRYFSNY